MGHEEMMARGRQAAITVLVDAACKANPLVMTNENRARVASNLRHLAMLVEYSPQFLAGLLVSAERVVGDKEGAATNRVLVGTTPFFGACHLLIEEICGPSFEEMAPHLEEVALSGLANFAAEVASAASPRLSDEQLKMACSGKLCPRCLSHNIKEIGPNPDGTNMNCVYDCQDCHAQWEGY